MRTFFMIHPARQVQGELCVCPAGLHTEWGVFEYEPDGRRAVAGFPFDTAAEEITQMFEAERALARLNAQEAACPRA